MSVEGKSRIESQRPTDGVGSLALVIEDLESANGILREQIFDETLRRTCLFERAVNALRARMARCESLLTQMLTTNDELQEERDYFRSFIVEHMRDMDQVARLEDELEVVRSSLALQVELHQQAMSEQAARHRAEIRRLEADREREIAECKRIIAEMTEKALSDDLKRVKARIVARHRRASDARREERDERVTQKWPKLNVRKTEEPSAIRQDRSIPVDDIARSSRETITCFHVDETVPETEKFPRRKRRKLFHEDRDDVFDIDQTE